MPNQVYISSIFTSNHVKPRFNRFFIIVVDLFFSVFQLLTSLMLFMLQVPMSMVYQAAQLRERQPHYALQ